MPPIAPTEHSKFKKSPTSALTRVPWLSLPQLATIHTKPAIHTIGQQLVTSSRT